MVSGVAQPNDLEARVAALEDAVQALTGRLRASEQDAAAARVLAGGADRDVTEIREQNTRVLSAMREDLGDLRGKVDTGFTEIRGKFDAAAAGQQQIVGLLTRLLGEGDTPTP
jgi:hypothetical protein